MVVRVDLGGCRIIKKKMAKKCNVTLPDEKMRRVGQSVAAASLPALK